MKKHSCMVCGKKRGVREFILPHGSVFVHPFHKCIQTMTNIINDGSSPILWLGMGDLKEHNNLSEEILDHYTGDTQTIIELAKDAQDYDYVLDNYSELLSDLSRDLEMKYIKDMPDIDLPLVSMDSLKTREAKALLETRLKGDKV